MPYPSLGASNRVRIEQYIPSLAAAGITLDVSAFLDDAAYRVLYAPGAVGRKAAGVAQGVARRLRDLTRARRYDVVLVHRESAPVGPPLVERALNVLGVPFVFDFDDAIFLGPVHPANRRWAWLRAPSRAAESVRLATSVIAGNEYLAAWARPHNRRVTVIPSGVDTERYHPFPRPAGGSLVVGWVGSTTTAPYLRLLDGPLARLARTPAVRVRVIGGAYAHPDVPVECAPYDLASEPEQVAAFDIGVLPEPDDPWTRGKGAFKALLYMAAALPVVASRVGVNPEVVIDGESGFCVDGDEGWVSALERLVADADLRRRMGQRGRERVEDHYSVRVLGPRLAAALRAAAGE